MALSFWKNLSIRNKRILSIIIIFVISVMMVVSGILTPLSSKTINDLGEGFEGTQETINSLPETQQVSFIFGNNFMISLIGFIPIVGPIFESYVLYSTGVIITAYVTYTNQPGSPLLLFLVLLVFPFTWLEFLAYSSAMSESFWLLWRLIQRRGKGEIKNFCMMISMCAVMLLLAAIIEVAIISYL